MKDLDKQLLSSADEFVSAFLKRINWLNSMVSNPPEGESEDYARSMYIEMIKCFVSALVFGNKEMSVDTHLRVAKQVLVPFVQEKRDLGLDWSYLGDTMTGKARLNNVQ